jgi:DNA-binding TFAR19-related protein (PDSD5 family)
VKLKNVLEAVARERLVKTKLAGKGLAGAAVIFLLWRLAVTL